MYVFRTTCSQALLHWQGNQPITVILRHCLLSHDILHIYCHYPPSHSCHTLVSQRKHNELKRDKRDAASLPWLSEGVTLEKNSALYYFCNINYFLICSSDKTHLGEMNVFRNESSDEREAQGKKEWKSSLFSIFSSLGLFRVEWNGPLMI